MSSFLRFRVLNFPGSRLVVYPLALMVILPLLWQAYQRLQPSNGFDISDASVSAAKIVGGGPGRDDIPALRDPDMLPASEVDLSSDVRVLGVVINGNARAYPLNILNWHEIVNDSVDGQAILVTWCPLCSTGLAFLADIEGERSTFGVSGLLYQENLLMYDHKTQSLWSQMKGEAISGQMKGATLATIPMAHTTFGRWRSQHPDTLVLSADTGYGRDYTVDPYEDYHQLAKNLSEPSGLAPYERVIGLQAGNVSRAYPFSELARNGNSGQLKTRLGERELVIDWDALTMTYEVDIAPESDVTSATISYWFAWKSFYPDTEVYRFSEDGQ